MGTLLSNSWLRYFIWTCCLSTCIFAKPFDNSLTDTRRDDATDYSFGLWIAAVAGFVCISTSLAVCVCCRKPKGFAEFRSSTQLAEMSPAQPGELTLFPPPSLALNREDLEVSFEPLPRPLNQAINAYRPKEVNEWIENGQGLFPRSNIQYLREVGRGWFGQVVEAEVKDLTDNSTRCVVKILRPEATATQNSKFLKDVETLLKLDHPHVMKLYACCLENSPLLVLLQHCANGDLKQFLAAYSPSKGSLPPLPENVLLRMACEAAEGLSQWHQAGFFHPDVAARSFMVNADMTIVIGDYGTHTYSYRDDFLDTGHQLLPIRWCAPECFQLSSEIIPTQAGNIWSFGVVLWEILTMGTRPYVALTDDQVVQQVLQEKRTILNPPAFSYQQGQSMYQLMLQCWEVDAPLRPHIETVLSRLAGACAGASRDVELDLEKAFDSRWNAAKPSESPSASLNNLHGSLDNLDDQSKEILSPDKESESGFSAKVSAALRSLDEALAAAEATDDEEEILPEPQFQLGEAGQEESDQSSDNSLFSSRSWQDKVARGELTALVSEKSRSVQDLMILTHVEPMSDVEFKLEQLPQISVTSPSFTVRSPMMESDVPLLGESSETNKDCLDTGTYMERNRNRLTSTPREDTDFEAMESSFRDRSKPAEYAPFSPESLDATNFTPKEQGSRNAPETLNSSTSAIMGPSEDMGLSVFQSVTSAQSEDDEEVFEPPRMAVNLEVWNQYLERGYPHQQPIADVQLDSGIAPPSFTNSLDNLGNTFAQDDNREWMDDLSLVARMWNEELAAAMEVNQMNASLTDPDASGLSDSSPSKKEATYFSYDKIDEDIREEEAVRRKDLSTIREERESVSSSDATPHSETGRGFLSQLQMKNRMQRQLDMSDTSDSDGSEDCRDDDEDVLVVDLENKRAVMLEGQSPKLRAAIATQNFETIFAGQPIGAHSIMQENGDSLFNGRELFVPNGNKEKPEEDEDEAHGGDEHEDDEENVVNDFEDDDDEEGDEGIAESNFVWQACYPAKLNQSFSMEVIEEECEDEILEDENVEKFVPSTWNAEATPTRPAIKSPEKSDSSPRKSVSFSQKKKKDIYEYPVEEPVRRQWAAPPTESTYADFADWEYAGTDEESKEVEDPKPIVISRPMNPLSNNMLYRLSGIDYDEDEELASESLKSDWQAQFSLTEFNQFEGEITDQEESTNNNGVEEANVVGTLRHTLESGRLRLDLTRSLEET